MLQVDRGIEVLDTRDRLIAAATLAFSAGGFRGASIRAIERAADVKRGLVGYHFGTKEALWCATIDRLMDAYKAAFDECSQEAAASASERQAQIHASSVHRFQRTPFRDAAHPDSRGYGGFATESVGHRDIRQTRSSFLRNVFDETPAQTVAIQVMWRYIIAGAASYVFTILAQCRLFHVVDPMTPSFVAEFTRIFETIDFQMMLSGSAA